jgi:hypothetical protein
MSNGIQEHKVTVFAHAGVAKVWPPYIVVKAGDSVKFSAVGTSATIIFPHKGAFDTDKMDANDFEEQAGGWEILLRLTTDGSAVAVTQADELKMDLDGLRSRSHSTAVTEKNYQVYAYSVYCGEVNDLAQGQSSPVMIIEPPDDRP